RPSRTPTSLTPVPFTNPRSYRLSLSEHAIHDVDSSVEDTEMKRLTDMWHGSRTLLTLLTIAALGAGGPLVAADHDDDGPIATTVFTLSPSTHGNPEGVAFDPASGAFFVGALGDGTIYRGTLNNPIVTEFIPGAPGKQAVGMKVAAGKLYVAGGFSGAARVYDIATKRVVAS